MVDLTLGTILAQMLNFFILVWILARFAYKPLVSMMQERKERIAKDLADAQAARNEAEQFKADYAAQIANARQDIVNERDRAMNNLRNEVISLSVAMATKVVAKDMDSETNTKLIEDAIAKLDSKTIGL